MDYLECLGAKEGNQGAKVLSHGAHVVAPSLQWVRQEPHLSNQILELATTLSTFRSTGLATDLEVDLEVASEA